LSWWWQAHRGDNVRSIMQVQDLQYAEQKDMALDIKKLADSQARIVAVLENCVTLIASQNEAIATLKTQLAKVPPASTGATPDEQAAVDAVAQALSDKAVAVAEALPPPAAPPASPPTVP
jgi:hypothetical protein